MTITINSILLLLLGFTAISAGLPVQNSYFLSKDYKVTILGTSNLRDWQETVEKVTGNVVVNLNEDGSVDLVAIDIRMDANSIKSDMGSIMNNKTYDALKTKTNPEIIFSVSVPVKLIRVNPAENVLAVKGNLTLAGVCKSVIMRVKSFTLGKGKLQFEGSQAIRMTDYGVKPPSALFGTMRASPEITINFETNFTNK